MGSLQAQSQLVEDLKRLRREYDIREGNGGDFDRRRIAILICDTLLQLALEGIFAILGKPKSIRQSITDDEAAILAVDWFEAALYAALQEHRFRCDSTEEETTLKAIRAGARTHQQHQRLNSTRFNPLALSDIAEFTPEQAVKRYPIIREVIAILTSEQQNKEEHHVERRANRRANLEERLERRRVA